MCFGCVFLNRDEAIDHRRTVSGLVSAERAPAHVHFAHLSILQPFLDSSLAAQTRQKHNFTLSMHK